MKLALLGGGGVRSVFFAQSIAKYAARLNITELALMDCDEEKLSLFGTLSQYAVSGISTLKVTLTTSVEEAVTGADYVVTAIRVGGDHSRTVDERVALNMGVLGQETTGAGGFSYAMRTIPVLLDYMKIIREKSNNATVFHFTNPAGLVTQALHDAGYANTIGICDNATGCKIEMSKALGIDSGDLRMRVYGLNHLTWADSVEYRGVEILDTLLANEDFVEHYHDFQYYDRDLIRHIHAIPNGYLYYYYHRERALGNILSAVQTRGESVERLNNHLLETLRRIDVVKHPQEGLDAYLRFMRERDNTYMTTELKTSTRPEGALFSAAELGIPDAPQKKAGLELLEGYAGVALNYIESKQKNLGIDLAINVLNQGAIPFLRDDDVIEVTTLVDSTGAHPVKLGRIPEENELLIRQVKTYERYASAAIREKDLEKAAYALMNHPLVGSWSQAKELVRRYKLFHEQFLTEWH